VAAEELEVEAAAEEVVMAEAAEEVATPEAEAEEEVVPAIDDLGTSLVEAPAPKEKVEKPKVVIVRTGPAEAEETPEEAEHRKGRELVFDEQAGRVVTKRKRKGTRRRPEWEEFDELDVDELLDED
jgi:hypothetical protein